MHTNAIPLLGGVAIFLGYIFGTLIIFASNDPVIRELKQILIWITPGMLIILVVGIIDDIKGLAVSTKIIFEIIAAITLIPAGLSVEFLTNPFGPEISLGWIGWIVTVGWVLIMINAMNFVDGLDGLASGIALISALVLVIISIINGHYLTVFLSVPLIGSALGFFLYNRRPASIFMGDTGSLVLGFLLAALTLSGSYKGATTFTLLVPLMALGVPLLDTVLAAARRTARRALHRGDREHIHHILVEKGFTHGQASYLLLGITVILAAVAVLLTLTNKTAMLIVALLGVIIMLIAGVVAYRNYRKKVELK
jgi:UDP-GlcNAc:undecaprenyl-phosphate GlcNAc-1-phosphate transferase